MSVATLENIGMRYDKGAEVLSDLSFTIPQGAFTFLSGPSGSGKTSLIRLLTIDALPGRGRLTLFGADVNAISRRERAHLRRKIGVVWQDFRLLPDMTAFDNVALPLRLMGEAPHKIETAVNETLRWVGLHDVRDRLPPMLSGGQQQRVAVARAVIARPQLIIADEPTGNLDEQTGLRIFNLFQQLHAMGTTVLVATHAPALIAAQPTAKRLYLNAGRMDGGGQHA